MSAIVHDVEHVISDVVSTIKHGLEQILHTLGSVVSDIYHAIVRGLESVYDYLSHNVFFLGLLVIVVIVIVAYLEPELFAVVFSSLETWIVAIPTEVAAAQEWLITTWTAIKASWVASAAVEAYGYLQDITKVNEAALTIKDFEQGHYLAGLDRLFNEVLPEMATQFDGKIQSLINNTTRVFRTFDGDINAVATTADELNTGLGQLQSDFRNIGEAFGVKALADIGGEIGKFRRDTLDRFTTQARAFEHQLNQVFFSALNPFIQWDNQYHLIKQNDEQAMRRLHGLVAWAIPKTQPQFSSAGVRLTSSGTEKEQVRSIWLRILQAAESL